jgi:hypothetical protein
LQKEMRNFMFQPFLVTIQHKVFSQIFIISNFASSNGYQWRLIIVELFCGTKSLCIIFFTILTIPLIIFSDLKALDAIKIVFNCKQTLTFSWPLLLLPENLLDRLSVFHSSIHVFHTIRHVQRNYFWQWGRK